MVRGKPSRTTAPFLAYGLVESSAMHGPITDLHRENKVALRGALRLRPSSLPSGNRVAQHRQCTVAADFFS